MQPDQTGQAAFSCLMQECFETNRQLISAVGQLTRDSGITGAQWGVLGAFGASGGPITVATAARRLGLARQGVQRVADLLEKKKLIEYVQNPHHRRAKLAKVTDQGRTLLDSLQQRQSRWSRQAAGDLDVEQLKAAAELVRSIRQRLLE